MKRVRLAFLASPSVHCLFLLLLAFALSRHLISVNAQGVGFISIDCGSSNESRSGNISWTADVNYTSLGVNNNTRIDADAPYNTLRSFPDPKFKKSCYVFNTTVSMSYLIRAGFFYGNYDNKSTWPTFDLLFGANVWTTVNSTANETVTHEMIALATRDTSSVCVGRTSDDVPFISSLEIRPLSMNQNMYSPVYENYLMKSNSRHNFGQTTSDPVRYPDDAFDRIWESDLAVITNITMFNTTLTTSRSVPSNSTDDLPPSKVMQTARSPNMTTDTLGFNFNARLGPGEYYLALYFAELDNQTGRIMDVYVDGNLVLQDLNVSNHAGFYNALELFYKNLNVSGSSYRLSLMPTGNSSSSPIINAAESYFLQKISQSTSEQDVQALETIKSAFNLLTWMGDPCLPSVFKWTWLDCDNINNQIRITALNLSSMGLPYEIPSTISNLSALTSLDLHNNLLFGNVPPSLASLNLTFLDLSNNNLSGVLPSELRNLTNSRITGNPYLCDNSSCAPVALSEPSESGSTHLLIGLSTSVFVVVCGAILFLLLRKRKYQKKKDLFGVPSAHWPPVPPFTEISKSRDCGVAVQNGGSDVPIYSFDDIKIMTNNFENRINTAGGSTLYHGALSEGQEVVVKLLQSNIEQTPMEFLYKVTPLSHVNHKNLLRPIGFCAENHRFTFVYEHSQKGSLYDYLHNKHALDWKTRLSILQQVAQGLEHLHDASVPSIIHGNLKSSNVLLSGDFLLAKVSDFGIWGLSPNMDATSGYLDPEFFSTPKLTRESDVYSFGVLILEVVCGRMPMDSSQAKDARNIVDWARGVGNDEHMVDAYLNGKYKSSNLSTVVQLALKATASNINERPTMAELAMELKEVNKLEAGHHVVFAEQEMSDYFDCAEVPSSPAYKGRFEYNVRQHLKP